MAAAPAWDWRTASEDAPELLDSQGQEAVDPSRALFAVAVPKAGSRPAAAPSLTCILVNMIEEYARRNGHPS